ncbi:50S ribosomal protein L32 [Candidatus Gottesmanbacteria bacterium RIFCSPLOWO2_01_FULL_49_10]|uniref:Large ribosomal subunit protein bL32 n=1 Tax=Candidatus Gottesmanbacteria bacterium RIFCSPLOWO2_01_FULL_49_10 TaxID=1798396 RepID=A0A1F6B1E3_9BACT|nr:MAG: 50S ribosomal protein L32 [Candidatus Gottesmanbacteria bacterium RIFCSPLOWO2_01_FULL_49_10]
MAPLPKRRHSTRRGGKRVAAIRLLLPQFVKCAQCGALRRPHRVCRHCGSYDGKTVMVKKEKKKKS